MFNYVTVEHVHARVIGELKLDFERFSGIEVPGLFHRFVGVTGSPIATDALLRDIVNMYGVHLPRRIRKDPLLGSSKDRPGIDSIGIEA